MNSAISMDGDACKTLKRHGAIHSDTRLIGSSTERGIELMRQIKNLCTWIVSGLLIFWPQIVMAAEKGKEAVGKKAPIVWVADTRNLTGFWGWTTDIYNENLYLYALLTILMMALWGVILGILMDFVMKGIGIDLKKREVKE